MAAILLAGFALRIYHLDLQAALGDDAFTLVIGQQSLRGIATLSRTEPHPPLFYVLLHFWQLGAGDSEFAGRFLGLWFGVAGLPAIYKLGTRLHSRALGLVAMLLAAPNVFLIAFAQQVRMYTMIVALVAISSYLLIALAQEPTRRRWVLYLAVTVLAVYCHFFSFFVVIGQGAFVLFLSVLDRRWRWFGQWILTQVVVAVLYVPWLIYAHDTLFSYTNGLVRFAPLPEMWQKLIPAFLSNDAALVLPWQLYGAVALLLLLGLSTFEPWRAFARVRDFAWMQDQRRTSIEGLFLASMLLIPPLAIFGMSIVRPVFFERYMVIAMPAFVLGLAAGIVAIARWFWPLALPLLAVGWAPAYLALPPYYSIVTFATGSDLRAELKFIDQNARPKAAVVVNLPPSDPMYRYYLPDQPSFFVPNPADDQKQATEDQLSRIVTGNQEIWFAPFDYDHSAFVEKWLDQHAFRVGQQWFANSEIIRYESPAPPAPGQASAATFVAPDARIELRNYQVYSSSAVKGDPLLFSLIWQADGKLNARYKVFTHLLDSQNKVVTQRDDEPVANKRPTTTWQPGETITDNYALVVPDTTPPGRYQLEIGLYRDSDGQRLKLADGDDRIILATISVTA